MQTSPDLMLGVLIHCWVHLAGVLGGEKTYSGSGIIIKIYPALSLATEGWDGMDGGGALWMMF
jgi:energy-converting hydrogenase Eha subunit G